jgi:hypothetical protein
MAGVIGVSHNTQLCSLLLFLLRQGLATLELLVLLSGPLIYQDYRCAPPQLAQERNFNLNW